MSKEIFFNKRLSAVEECFADGNLVRAKEIAEDTRVGFADDYREFENGYRLDFLLASAIAKIEASKKMVPDEEHLSELFRAIGLFKSCLQIKEGLPEAHMGLGMTSRVVCMALGTVAVRNEENTALLLELTEQAITHLQIAKRLRSEYKPMVDRNLKDLLASRDLIQSELF